MVLCVTLNPVVDTTFFVDRIEPVYRTDAQRVTHVAGGKGNNVARALIALQQPARVLLPLGGPGGRHMAELLAGETIESAVAWVSGETRLAVTVVDSRYRQQAYFAPVAPLTDYDIAEIRRCFFDALPGATALCMCGSSPGGLADLLYQEFLREAAGNGILTLLDTYGEALRQGLEAPPTIVKINRAEAEGLLGRQLDTLDRQVAALDDLRRNPTQWVVMTLGRQGALFSADGRVWAAQPPPVTAINPIGSGDAMAAGLLVGRLRHQPPEDCFRLGMASAVANTLTWEACRITASEVDALLDQIKVQSIK